MLDSSSSIEPDIVLAAHVLDTLNTAASAAGVEVLVIGATARNILSAGLFGRLPERATRDVDIAVAIPTWQAYQRLTENLNPCGGPHAFTVEISGVPIAVDIVPYGGIEDPDRTVRLPDEHTLHVLGLREAFNAAQVARLPGDVHVRVPTVAANLRKRRLTWGGCLCWADLDCGVRCPFVTGRIRPRPGGCVPSVSPLGVAFSPPRDDRAPAERCARGRLGSSARVRGPPCCVSCRDRAAGVGDLPAMVRAGR